VELDLSTSIWMIINFLVILAILYKFFYNPVLKFMDDRSEEIANNISEAERGRTEAAALLQEYQEKIAGANSNRNHFDHFYNNSFFRGVRLE
jgi:F-type H+-transporting ATPase subunit b